jgi:Bax protein
MRKYWIIYTIFSVSLVGCTFTQYMMSLKTKPQEQKFELEGHTIGTAPKFKQIKPIADRKRAFFAYLIPGIEYENSLLTKQRQELIVAKEKFSSGSLTEQDEENLLKLGKRYRVDLPESNTIDHDWFNQLLVKVDVLPVPLVLIQAANESAWGTSRFAREGNNYFGQWCYRKGCGLVPLARSEGMTHEVVKFSSVQKSIHYYFLNVNRNKAYSELRGLRAERRTKGLTMETEDAAYDLINGLIHYSEKGQNYVDILESMLRHNSKYWNLEK